MPLSRLWEGHPLSLSLSLSLTLLLLSPVSGVLARDASVTAVTRRAHLFYPP